MTAPLPSGSLAASRVGAANATEHVIMLHGIYGRGRNWQAIAKGVVASRPEYACWLVDLPFHGDSGPGTHGQSVLGVAEDVEAWLQLRRIHPDAILGHSYGGKVALVLAAHTRGTPLQVWVIDSSPEVKAASGSAWDMLQVIRRMPDRFASRNEIITSIVDAGFPIGVAQWMGTNLERDGDGFVWAIDFGVMEQLLRDFFAADLWSVVDAPPANLDVHFLKASASNAISPAAVTRIAAAPSRRVRLHHRDGGHWIHAESPDIVTALLIEHLPRAESA